MEIKTLTIDISKNYHHVCAFDCKGILIFKRVFKTKQFHKFLSQTPRCQIFMESCGMSNHWARVSLSCGHDAKLIATKYVKRYVDNSFKNDFRDALAIYDAATHPRARFVAVKSPEQQEISFLHRSRDRLSQNRTQLINQIRAYVAEFGFKTPQGHVAMRKYIQELCDPESSELGAIIKQELLKMLNDLSHLNDRIEDIEKTFSRIISSVPICSKIKKISGVGTIIATAIISEVADLSVFRSGREFAAWLGLVPKQMTTGNKTELGSITKAGNQYLRRQLIHGARSLYVLNCRSNEVKSKDLLWMKSIRERTSHANIAIVAMANKLARIIWAIVVHDREYDPSYVSMHPFVLQEAA